jgi:hypothetical protein
MRGRMFLFAAALAGLMIPLASAQAWLRVGIVVPIGPYYGPYYRPYYYPGVVVAAPPVVIQAPPVYVQPPPGSVYQSAPAGTITQSVPAQGPALAPAPTPLPR